ncbi:MAG TPA: hypothetical protein VIM73_07845 [Polyangiaceae bacterium]
MRSTPLGTAVVLELEFERRLRPRGIDCDRTNRDRAEAVRVGAPVLLRG